jgi:hypothetical protein
MLISTMKGNTAASVVAVDSLDALKEIIVNNDWSPAIFKHNYRNNENFESTSLMVLDIDDGLALRDAIELFAPYEHLIATTKSHQKEKDGKPACDRYRVVLRLSGDVRDRDTFTATWFELHKKFPFIDSKCKDPARFFYKCTDAFIHINPVGISVIPQLPAPKEAPKVKPSLGGSEGKGKLSQSTQDFLFRGAEPGTWNDRLFKAAKDAYEQGYDEDWFTARAILIMEEKRDNFDSKREESYKTIESAFSKDPKYGPRGLDIPDVRDQILKSHLFIANHDHNITRLVDLEAGKFHEITHDIIKMRLGTGKGGEYPAYASTNIRFANFRYEPHLNSVFFVDNHGMACFNDYQPPLWRREEFYYGTPVQPHGEIPDVYFEFFHHLVGGDEPSLLYLVDWLANSVQSRNFTILCAIGAQGIGKGRLGELMEQVHGVTNFTKVRDHVFKSQFNGQLANKTFVQVDEASLDTKEAIDRVKDVVNGQIEIEKKGEDARSLRNHASFYLSSNSIDAVKLEPGDRRFSIIELTETKVEDKPEIKRIIDDKIFMDPRNIDQLARYLKFKKITSNMMKPFHSGRWEQVREASLTDWENWVVFELAPKYAGDFMELETLQSKIQEKTGVRSPGRGKIELLCNKYPEAIQFVRGANRGVQFKK